MRSPLISLFALLLPATAVAAQQASPAPVVGETRTVVPGADYGASGLYRFFFGSNYRQLWTHPIDVPVLDLAAEDGGLTPTTRGGGQQTKSLRFRSPGGRIYSFRSVDKDPSAILPEELQDHQRLQPRRPEPHHPAPGFFGARRGAAPRAHPPHRQPGVGTRRVGVLPPPRAHRRQPTGLPAALRQGRKPAS